MLHQKSDRRPEKCDLYQLYKVHIRKNNTYQQIRQERISAKNKTNDKSLDQLADTGSPKNFVITKTAYELRNIKRETMKPPEKSLREFRCFSKYKIDIKRKIQLEFYSRSSSAQRWTVFLVVINRINIMRRNIIDKIGLHLTMSPWQPKAESKLFNTSNIRQSRNSIKALTIAQG